MNHWITPSVTPLQSWHVCLKITNKKHNTRFHYLLLKVFRNTRTVLPILYLLNSLLNDFKSNLQLFAVANELKFEVVSYKNKQ